MCTASVPRANGTTRHSQPAAGCRAMCAGMLEEPVPFLELVPKMEAAAECVTQGIRVRAIAWVTPHAEYNGNLLFSYRVHFSHVIQPVCPRPLTPDP